MNRFVLNETSYHGAGAINSIPEEIKGRGFKKVLVASDPDLVKFGVTKKLRMCLKMRALNILYIQTSNLILPYRMFSTVLKYLKRAEQIVLLQSAAVLQWIRQRRSA